MVPLARKVTNVTWIALPLEMTVLTSMKLTVPVIVETAGWIAPPMKTLPQPGEIAARHRTNGRVRRRFTDHLRKWERVYTAGSEAKGAGREFTIQRWPYLAMSSKTVTLAPGHRLADRLPQFVAPGAGSGRERHDGYAGESLAHGAQGILQLVSGEPVGFGGDHQERPARVLEKLHQLLIALLRGNVDIDERHTEGEAGAVFQVGFD